MKNVLKAIVDVFNNKYVKALYITIIALILGFCFIALLVLFTMPTLIVLMLIGIYIIILDVLD